MTFIDTAKELWPLLAAICSGGVLPFAIWYGRRLDKRQQNQEKHEERRTQAAEDIPRALRDLKDGLAESVRTESMATRQTVEAAKNELLKAIRDENIESLAELIRERLPSQPEITPMSARAGDTGRFHLRNAK